MRGSWLGIGEVDDNLSGLIRSISGLRKLRCENQKNSCQQALRALLAADAVNCKEPIYPGRRFKTYGNVCWANGDRSGRLEHLSPIIYYKRYGDYTAHDTVM